MKKKKKKNQGGYEISRPKPLTLAFFLDGVTLTLFSGRTVRLVELKGLMAHTCSFINGKQTLTNRMNWQQTYTFVKFILAEAESFLLGLLPLSSFLSWVATVEDTISMS